MWVFHLLFIVVHARFPSRKPTKPYFVYYFTHQIIFSFILKKGRNVVLLYHNTINLIYFIWIVQFLSNSIVVFCGWKHIDWQFSGLFNRCVTSLVCKITKFFFFLKKIIIFATVCSCVCGVTRKFQFNLFFLQIFVKNIWGCDFFISNSLVNLKI